MGLFLFGTKLIENQSVHTIALKLKQLLKHVTRSMDSTISRLPGI